MTCTCPLCGAQIRSFDWHEPEVCAARRDARQQDRKPAA